MELWELATIPFSHLVKADQAEMLIYKHEAPNLGALVKSNFDIETA
jgi:hypothetical protein